MRDQPVDPEDPVDPVSSGELGDPVDPAELGQTLARLEDALLGGPRSMTLAQMAAASGADTEQVRNFWHTLGLPTGRAEDAVLYTESDAEALRLLLEAAERHDVSQRTAVSLVRSIGHTTERLVLWQVEALVEHLAHRYELDDTSARLVVLDRLVDIAPVLEAQLVHAWRRQLAAVAGRFAAEFGSARGAAADDELPLARAVGFADIVSFTTRTAALGPAELSEFVQQFETRVRDVVTAAGGRVVKTIGDAVLFVADDVATGARVALGLAGAFGPGTPAPLRVAMVWGRVLSRFGDVFGPSVNLAARLTDEAAPGTVLLDADTAGRLRGHPEVVLTDLPAREVPGLGVLRPVLLSAGPAPR